MRSSITGAPTDLAPPGLPVAHAADPADDVQDGALIFQGGQPFDELRCFANFDHAAFVIYGLQERKQKVIYGLQ
jgi:hypothetical protein